MNNKKYFLDTYAIIEHLEGNPKYSEFNSENSVTSVFNILEFCYYLEKSFYNEERARSVAMIFFNVCIDIDFEAIFEASRFRWENKKLKLSYTDCMGYALAKRNGLQFVTGDEPFKSIEGVKFVK